MGSGILRERKKQEQEHEARILNVLAGRKKTFAAVKRENRRKIKYGSVSKWLKEAASKADGSNARVGSNPT